MQIENHLDVISACRFCFMCRHLDTTANVTYREADTPRGRALVLDRVRMNPEQLANPDFIQTLYDSALSAACRKHCVSHYDENGLVLSARQDIVEQDLTPGDVKQILQSIKQYFQPALTGDGAEVLVLQTQGSPSDSAALLQLLKQAGQSCQLLQVNDTGKTAYVLGDQTQAAQMAQAIAKLIVQSGCKKVVTDSPAAFDALKNDYPKWGVELDGISVEHSSTFLLDQIESGQLELPVKDNTVCYIDSDFLRNYNDMTQPPRQLLEHVGYQLKPFGTNPEESYALGEGAMVFDQLRPKLVDQMVMRFKSMMDDPQDLIITASPYTSKLLHDAGINVLTLEEAMLYEAEQTEKVIVKNAVG